MCVSTLYWLVSCCLQKLCTRIPKSTFYCRLGITIAVLHPSSRDHTLQFHTLDGGGGGMYILPVGYLCITTPLEEAACTASSSHS